MNLSMEKGHLGVYCVSTLERQSVKTTVVTDFANISWNEGCFLFFFSSLLLHIHNIINI